MASCFNLLIVIWQIRYFFFTFCPGIIWNWDTSIEDWKMLVRWCRTDTCSYKLSAKVSLMLDNPFLLNSYCKSLCKLNHISVYFIQISTKSPANSLFPSGKAIFFWSHPRCFGPLGKFQRNIKISIKTIISVFPDYLFLMTMIKLIQKFDGNFHLHFSQIIGKPNLFNSTFQQTFNCPKSTLKTLEKDVKYVQSRADVLIVSFEHISQLFLEFLLLTLSNEICYIKICLVTRGNTILANALIICECID